MAGENSVEVKIVVQVKRVCPGEKSLSGEKSWQVKIVGR